MKNRAGWLLIVASAFAVVGCGTGRPNIMHPGDTQSQRFAAIAHDPYYDNDAGPEVVGGRPREFQKPLSEPVRNRWLADSLWSRR